MSNPPSPPNLVAAVLQMRSTPDVAHNLARAVDLITRARARGAELAVLPENFALMSPSESDKLGVAEVIDSAQRSGAPSSEGDGPILGTMRRTARELGLHLILGGLPERSPHEGHVYNSCVHLLPDGSVAMVYRKVHLFDVSLASAGDSGTYRESSSVSPGEDIVATDTPWGKVGLSVCYDVRFPELYRRLSVLGTRILVVPAAFTLHTGKDHWHVLLRARAIENQCFVLAAAQQGQHFAGRQTYGHSLIVDPWGTVLAECPDGEGVAVAELDFAAQDRVRQSLPSLLHRRLG